MNKCECKAVTLLGAAGDGKLLCLMKINADQNVYFSILWCKIDISIALAFPLVAELCVKIKNASLAFFLYIT